MVRPPTASLLSARLDREWTAIRRRPRIVAEVRSWDVTDAPFADLDELLTLAGYRVPGDPAHDAVLLGLVVRAHTDALAARIVLQRVLPGLLAAVRRRRRPGDTEGLEELIGAAWLAILNCRLDPAPGHVAANIVRDATYRAFIAPSRRKSATEIAVDPRTLDETPARHEPSPCEELAGLLADARAAGLPPDDLDLVRHLVRTGSPATVAREQSVTPRTVRNRRDRATARLRRLALAA